MPERLKTIFYDPYILFLLLTLKIFQLFSVMALTYFFTLKKLTFSEFTDYFKVFCIILKT